VTLRLSILLLAVTVLSASGVKAQVVEGRDRTIDERAEPESLEPSITAAPFTEANSAANVDVQARFDAFQREFAKDFGFELEDNRKRPGDDFARKVEEDFARRFEGSAAFRWYERGAALYGRLEGIYDRLENQTRWATSGFDVDPDFEAAVDGKIRLHVERRMRGVHMGFDVDDAMAGKLGLRLSRVMSGYKLSLDVNDMVDMGRVGIRIKKLVH
jgi:hypothetical protein